MNNQPPSQPTDSLWDTLWQTRYWYSGAFLLIGIPSQTLVISGEFAQNQGIINAWRASIPLSADAMTVSFGAAFMITEGVRLTMVLAHGAKKLIDNWFEKRERKLREEGMVKGRTEANEAWAAWNARREEAEARGQPFSEPPPTHKP